MYGKLPLHQHSSSVTPPAHCPVVPRQMNSIYLYLEMEIKDAGEDKEAVRGAETIKTAFQHEPLVWMPDKASANKGSHFALVFWSVSKSLCCAESSAADEAQVCACDGQ